MHDPHGIRPAAQRLPDWEALRVKPPLPPDGKRPLSPASYRRSLTRSPLSSSPYYSALDLGRSRPTSPEPYRCSSPPPAARKVAAAAAASSEGMSERPQSPTPESEVARILSHDIPPKRNSVVNFPPGGCEFELLPLSSAPAEDPCRFRPISPPPAVPCSRPLSPYEGQGTAAAPAPRPFSPTPPDDPSTEESDSSPPPLPKSMPPLWPSQMESRPSSTPSYTVLRIRPINCRGRPLSAPNHPGVTARPQSPPSANRPMSPLSTNRPMSPPPSAAAWRISPLSASRPLSPMKDSRLVSYRPFQALEDNSEQRGQRSEDPESRAQKGQRPERRLRRWRLETRRSKTEPLLQVPSWSVDQVVAWVNQSGFQDYAAAFLDSGVDGDILLMLTEHNIIEDIGIRNGILRKRFMRELAALKKNADYSGCEGGLQLAAFLGRITPEYRAYTYNLISHDLSLPYMQHLEAVELEDMLRYAGVDSTIHRHKIVEAVLSCQGDEEDSLADSLYSEPSTDVYLSYPRAGGGAELASLIAMQLRLRDLSIVAEAHDTVNQVSASEAVLEQIRDARFYVLIMPSGALDSCLEDSGGDRRPRNNRLYMEISTALEAGLNIIPVTLDFQWPDLAQLPKEIRDIGHFNEVRWVHDYQHACLDKLEKFIRQDGGLLGARTESPYINRSGRSTPYGSSTSLLLSPHVRARGIGPRTVSIDSAIGS